MVSNIRVSPSFVDPTDAEKVGVIFVVFVLFKTDANVAASVVVSLLSAYLSSNATAAAGEVVLTRNLKVVVLESRRLLLLLRCPSSGISSISAGSTPSSNAKLSISA
jgi:hypothetical protein